MPQWRKLHLKTVESLDINDMPDDFIRLTWVLLPLGLDSEGRGLDNPAWIKSHIFPLRTDVSLSMIEGAIQWFTERHMIHRYEVDGRHYFCIPTFHKYQGNTSREASSQYPAPPGPKPPQEEEQHDNGNDPDIDEDNSRVTHELLTSKSSTDVDSDTDIDSIPKGIGADAPPHSNPIPESLPQKAKARPANKSDPPPAVTAYREIANRYPDKATWGLITDAVGSDPANLERWQETVRAYIACGWNKTNIKGMLEFYKRSELPATGKQKEGQNGRQSYQGDHRQNEYSAEQPPPGFSKEQWAKVCGTGE